MLKSPRRELREARKLACASALAISLAGCGGGGGTDVGFIPPPPPAPVSPPPQPTPAPAPTSGTVGAPLRATVGAGPAPVLASPSGPNFRTGVAAGTTFPLLQTVLVIDNDSIDGDAPALAAGGSGAFDSTGLFNINTVHMHPGQTGSSGMNGDPIIWDSDNLDWTRAGYWNTGGVWDYMESPFVHRGVFVTGYETPASGMPTSGTATFTGRASGAVYFPVTQGTGQLLCNCAEVGVGGDASFTANFGARTIGGSLTNMWAGGDPWFDDPHGQTWNNVAFSSTITGNAFSGTTSVTSAPGGERGMAGTAAGTIEGRFFGPGAQEAGAVWTLFDGVKAAIGTITGKRP